MSKFIKMLSEKVKELIEKSRIVSFDDWSYPNQVLEIFRQAENEGRYLTDRSSHFVSMSFFLLLQIC